MPSHTSITDPRRCQGGGYCQQNLINESRDWPGNKEGATAELIAQCLALTTRQRITSVRKPRRTATNSGSMGEKAKSEGSLAANSQVQRSHTSQGLCQHITASHAVERPCTVTGCTKKTFQPTQGVPAACTNKAHRLDNSTKLDTHMPSAIRWNNSARTIQPPSAALVSRPRTQRFIVRPPGSTKCLNTMASTTTDLLTVRKLYDENIGTKADYLSAAPSQNVAVQTAFDRAIAHKEVTSDRLRVGLITNDITPRVYLQESQGTRHFRKMNMKLRDELTEVYNYRHMESSLPPSLPSDTDSSDDRSDGQ
ncbi:uncharacterized protein [Watersipora subatra]|uniref:uncharacterized protein n=1 Tax=Watersipora subatra TaxID=2589382 RepID=UPI00355B4504